MELTWGELPRVELPPLAHGVTISSFQFPKNDRREESHPAKHKERPVDAVNELWGT